MRDMLVVLVLVALSTPILAGASGKWTPVEFRNLVGGPELTVSEMSSRYGDGFTTKRVDAGNLPNADANDSVVQYSYNNTAVFSFFVDGDNGKEFLMAWQIRRGFDGGKYADLFDASMQQVRAWFRDGIIRETEHVLRFVMEASGLIFRFDDGTVDRITWQINI